MVKHLTDSTIMARHSETGADSTGNLMRRRMKQARKLKIQGLS